MQLIQFVDLLWYELKGNPKYIDMSPGLIYEHKSDCVSKVRDKIPTS